MKFPQIKLKFGKTAACGAEAAFVDHYSHLELLSIVGGPTFPIFDKYRGSVLILRERDLDLRRPLQDANGEFFVHSPCAAE